MDSIFIADEGSLPLPDGYLSLVIVLAAGISFSAGGDSCSGGNGGGGASYR
jgi:hypothetical protein